MKNIILSGLVWFILFSISSCSPSEVPMLKSKVETMEMLVDQIYEARTYTVRATAYTNCPSETNDDPSHTAIMRTPVVGKTVAVSQDKVHWLGHKLYVKGKGVFVVEDLMNKRFTDRIDFYVGTKKEAFEFGVQELEVVLLN
jgi:3D (Asp-Asp-Asp) domain-containing protein